jgi:hypothetical protein
MHLTAEANGTIYIYARVVNSIGDGKLSVTTLARYFAPSACIDYESPNTNHTLAWRLELHTMERGASWYFAVSYLAFSQRSNWDKTDKKYLPLYTAPSWL